ncbi:MAG: metal ABC transporter substrate-binding protein [Gammaproteobacteria bacterium]
MMKAKSLTKAFKSVALLITWLSLSNMEAFAVEGDLKACATVPELGSLLRDLGGDRIAVTVFAKGTEDPHFVEAKPSFIKAMNECDLYVQVGLELEIGWAPALLQNARNARVLPGSAGFLDTSQAIAPLDVPTQAVDRSMGDVHPFGNPHYLADPLNGLAVAELIVQKLGELRPLDKGYFEGRYADFSRRLAARLVGDTLARRYLIEDVKKLAQLFARGKLKAFLDSQGQGAQLGGWLRLMLRYYGTKIVDDHNLWPYFAHRFGLVIAGHMEPKPGIPPTTLHMQDLVKRMQADAIKIVITSAYFDPRHGQFLAEHTGARVLAFANQVGAWPGTDDYLAMIDYNVKQLAATLGRL